MVERTGDAHGERQRGLSLDRKVGEHGGHERLTDQERAKGLALPAMADRLRNRHTHAGGRTDHAIEAGHGGHLDYSRHAPTLYAVHPSKRAAKLRFARRVRDVPDLAFEADDLQRV